MGEGEEKFRREVEYVGGDERQRLKVQHARRCRNFNLQKEGDNKVEEGGTFIKNRRRSGPRSGERSKNEIGGPGIQVI